MKYFLRITYKNHEADTNYFLDVESLEDAWKYVQDCYKNISNIENIEVLEVANVHQYQHIITRKERIKKQAELTAAKKAAELEAKEKAELARLQEKYGKV